MAQATSIAVAPDGTLVVIALLGTTGNRGVARFDLNTQQFTTLLAPDPTVTQLNSVFVASDGGIIVLGCFECDVNDLGWMRMDPVTGAWGSFPGPDPYSDGWYLANLPNGRVAIGEYDFAVYHVPYVVFTSVSLYSPTGELSSIWRQQYWYGLPDLAPGITALRGLPNGDLVMGVNDTGNWYPKPPYVHRFSAQSRTWSSVGASLASPVQRFVGLPGGDVVAETDAGLFRFHDGASGWAHLPPVLGGTTKDMLALPNGDLLLVGSFGQWPNDVPLRTFLARYVFSTPSAICPSDFDCSGVVNLQDLFAFIAAWFSSDPRSDFDGVNGRTVDDIFEFLRAWFIGC